MKKTESFWKVFSNVNMLCDSSLYTIQSAREFMDHKAWMTANKVDEVAVDIKVL